MTYSEYCTAMKEEEIPEELEFVQAILWLHPYKLPLGLYSLGNSSRRIIKVPRIAVNRYGNTVPVIYIAKDTFAGNGTVTDIILPSSIERLPKGAFAGCSGLRNITIPTRARFIAEKTFDGCISLENVYYEGTEEEWDMITVIHERHEIDFGECIPGTPVQETIAERRIHIPGNDALFSANIHFKCDLDIMTEGSSFIARGTDVTEQHWSYGRNR